MADWIQLLTAIIGLCAVVIPIVRLIAEKPEHRQRAGLIWRWILGSVKFAVRLALVCAAIAFTGLGFFAVKSIVRNHMESAAVTHLRLELEKSKLLSEQINRTRSQIPAATPSSKKENPEPAPLRELTSPTPETDIIKASQDERMISEPIIHKKPVPTATPPSDSLFIPIVPGAVRNPDTDEILVPVASESPKSTPLSQRPR